MPLKKKKKTKVKKKVIKKVTKKTKVKKKVIKKKIPQQISELQKANPPTGTTQKIFNAYAQKPYYWMAIEKLKRFPATISQPILQLMVEWSFLNKSGYRYKILDTPNCPICKTPETTQHYLIDCVVFENKRKPLKTLLKEHKLKFTLKNLFGINQVNQLTNQQRHSIYLSLYDYISSTKRKRLGFCLNLEKWKQL